MGIMKLQKGYELC